MTKLYRYQKEGVRLIEEFDGRALLADEMGLGKSIQSLAWLALHPMRRPAVVVCPAGLKLNWAAEARIHFNWPVEILSGTKPDRVVANRRALYVINWDILGGWMEFLRQLEPSVVVGDEVHYCTNPAAKRTKWFKALCEGVKYVIGLSGTPLVNRPIELYTILSILRPKLFPSRLHYAMKYCDLKMGPRGWDYSGASNLGQLHDSLKESCLIRRLKTDVLKDLPPQRRIVVPVELSKRGEYDEAENDFRRWLRRKIGKRGFSRALRAEAMVKIGYLKRLAGLLKLPAVTAWLSEFLAECDDKIIVFGYHKAVLAHLTEKFKGRHVLVDGGVPSGKRQDRVDQFRNNPDIRVFIGQIRAASAGWNGNCASRTMFAEYDWVPGIHAQAEARPHRIGQKFPVESYYLTAFGTVEERICEKIQAKQLVVSATLDGGPTTGGIDLHDQVLKTYLDE